MGSPDSAKKNSGTKAPQTWGVQPPSSPSPGRSSPFKRNGSLGKGTQKKTTPHRPMLATEARSLVRPCGCGKDGVFKNHAHTHDSHHRAPVSPERTMKEPRTPKSPQVTRRSRASSLPPDNLPSASSTSNHQPQQPKVKPNKKPVAEQNQKPSNFSEGANRFVSTVVWHPELKPEYNTTSLQLSPGEDSSSYVDEILLKEYDSYVKRMFPNAGKNPLKLDGPLYMQKVTASDLKNSIQGSFVPPNIRFNPVSVS